MSEWGSVPKMHFTVNVCTRYLFSVHLQKSWKKSSLALKYPALCTYGVYFRPLWDITFSVSAWKLDDDAYSSHSFWGRTSPKRQSRDLSCLPPCWEAGTHPGWGVGVGVALAPQGAAPSFPLCPPPRAGRRWALPISAHRGRGWVSFPWTGTGWSPSHSAGSLLGATFLLPGRPSGKQEPTDCKLSFGNLDKCFRGNAGLAPWALPTRCQE